MTTAELARAEMVKPQSMGTLLAELEQEGLVQRQPHPTDGRQILFSLTDAGRGRRGASATRPSSRGWPPPSIASTPTSSARWPTPSRSSPASEKLTHAVTTLDRGPCRPSPISCPSSRRTRTNATCT